jgi:hypothetical protein
MCIGGVALGKARKRKTYVESRENSIESPNKTKRGTARNQRERDSDNDSDSEKAQSEDWPQYLSRTTSALSSTSFCRSGYL